MASMLNMETITHMWYAKASKGSPSTLSQMDERVRKMHDPNYAIWLMQHMEYAIKLGY